MRAVFYFMSINIVEDVVQISRETGGISINSLLVSTKKKSPRSKQRTEQSHTRKPIEAIPISKYLKLPKESKILCENQM